jgi:Ca2+-binding EF-hand superfamily protein
MNQMLAAMLSRLTETQAQQSSTSASSASSTTDTSPMDSSDALTGTDTSTLSDQILGMLVMMQGQQQSQGSDPPGTTSSTSPADPFQQAFASIDTDGDDSISQSELETAVENAGGTASQADTLYTALGGTDSSGISESQFASDAQAGGPPPGGPPPGGPGGASGHHHHHHGGSSSTDASDEASQLMRALDTNGDGTISESELSTALGSPDGSAAAAAGSTGTSPSTSAIFSAIDTNGDGSVTQSELTSYLQSLQQQTQSNQTVLSAFSSLVNQSYNSSLSLLSSSAASQTAYA